MAIAILVDNVREQEGSLAGTWRDRLSTVDGELGALFASLQSAGDDPVRQYLRANPAIRAQGCPYPEYTPEFERMVALVERYRTQLGSKQ